LSARHAPCVARLGPLLFCGLGLPVAPSGGSGTFPDLLWRGLLYGALLYPTNSVHKVGHIVSGWLAGSRMDANVLTTTRDVGVYSGPKKKVATGASCSRNAR